MRGASTWLFVMGRSRSPPTRSVTLYLLQSLNIKLMPKLQAELKPGTRIVSQSFNMGDAWPPDKQIEANGYNVYMWTVK